MRFAKKGRFGVLFCLLALSFTVGAQSAYPHRAVRIVVAFSPGGVTKFIEAATRIGLGENDPSRSGFENAARVNRALLRERFGKVTTRHLEHTAVPMRKSVLFELEAEFPEDFARTSDAAAAEGTNGSARRRAMKERSDTRTVVATPAT